MRRAVIVALVCVLHPSLARAQDDQALTDLSEDGDYDVDHKGWNGLSTLAALAEGSGLSVRQWSSIEWSDLDSNDVVLLLYPTSHLDPSNMVTFIRNGGRVLIADDFGSGAAIFGQLGARRSEEVISSSYHDRHVFAPIATPSREHPLSHGITELTTNHPTMLRNLEGMDSIFRFDDGSTLVATGEIGNGRYVVLSDPSVLINRMLQFEGNLQFSINLLRYLARAGESDRIVVLSGSVNLAGSPRNRYDDGTWRGAATAQVAQLDGWLDEFNTWYFKATTLRLLTLFMALALSLWVFLVLPGKRKTPLDGAWTRSGPLNEELGYESMVETYEQAGARTSYLLPAAIARDNVNSALELAIESPDPLFGLSEKELLARVHAARGADAAAALRNFLPHLHALPQRAQAALHWQPRHLGRGEFETLHTLANELFEILDTNPQRATTRSEDTKSHG